MAGHVDLAVVVSSPLDLCWRVTNDVSGWGPHITMLASSDGGRRFSFEVAVTPADGAPRWSYRVERSLDRERGLVHARRYDHPDLRYSVAWWLYDAVPGGTRLRCVHDFETWTGDPAGDGRMTERIAAATRAELDRAAGRVAAAAPSA